MQQESIWQGPPLVLASKSAGRRALLEAAGLHPRIEPTAVDERSAEAEFTASGGKAADVAAVLARAKAEAAGALRPDGVCVGCDQVMTLDGRALHQTATMPEAKAQLARLSGRTHRLTSAACVVWRGARVFEAQDKAELTMRPLDAGSIDRYFALAGPEVLGSVGAYQIEGLGVHLFDKVEGDHATIVGLPLLALLAGFRAQGWLTL